MTKTEELETSVPKIQCKAKSKQTQQRRRNWPVPGYSQCLATKCVASGPGRQCPQQSFAFRASNFDRKRRIGNIPTQRSCVPSKGPERRFCSIHGGFGLGLSAGYKQDGIRGYLAVQFVRREAVDFHIAYVAYEQFQFSFICGNGA